MRIWPLAAALLVLTVPSASAASSSVELSGPSSVAADAPTSVTLELALLLDGVVCAGDAEVPVDLRIVETRGLRSASLTWDRVLFRIAGHQAATTPWKGEGEVGVRVWGRDPTGHVEVLASYTLPPSCVAPGAQSGEASHVIQVRGPQPPPDQPVRAIPPAMPKSETILAPSPQAPQESAQASIGAGAQTLPGAVLGAILGMFAGGVVVFVKRTRARRDP